MKKLFAITLLTVLLSVPALAGEIGALGIAGTAESPGITGTQESPGIMGDMPGGFLQTLAALFGISRSG